MQAKRLGRSLVLFAVLGFFLLQMPVSAALLEGPGGPAAQVSVSGEIEIFTGGLPAVWTYDYEQKRILIDIHVQAELRTWALLDWSGAHPTGFIGREDGCFSFPIEQKTMPAPDQFERLLEAPAYDESKVGPADVPEGITSVREEKKGETFLLVKETDAVLIFRAQSASRVEHLAALSKDTSHCQPLSGLVAALKGSLGHKAPTEQADAAQASLLQYNHPYTFRGWFYGHLKYKGKVFSQTKPAYDAALSACTSAGPNECKPYWEIGGAFGRYGYHCGDGWGNGQNKHVSGQDYCCSLHDGQSWGKNQAENLCGFAACMTCKYYGSIPDWEQNFKGDFWAQKVIAGFVGTGIAAIACYPQSPVTGFTCD